ncbi:MAG TPA: peptidylprolyl isomerase [Myxococcales bacterium]|jgi:peptidyl-prolyl cis-trans isomerase A (cyclophilin A)
MRHLPILLAALALPSLALAAEPAKAEPAKAAAQPAKQETKQEAKPGAAEPGKQDAKPVAPPAKKWSEQAKSGETIYATMQTSMGDITLKLFTKDAPKTVENFVALATGERQWVHPRTSQKMDAPLYDGTTFHRVIPNFMIQGGDPRGDGTGGPGYEFEDEFKSGRKFDKPCLLAMANSGPNTNGSQFFITEVPTRHLDGRHTIFGEVIKGCELVGKIARAGNQTPVALKKVVLSLTAPK